MDPPGPRARTVPVAALAALCAASMARAEPVADDCMMEPAVFGYLGRVQDEILDHWRLPEDGMANREVTVRLRFEEDGRLTGARVVSATDTRLERSVAAAILAAAPFAPVPPEARCLVGRPIVTTFRNPTD